MHISKEGWDEGLGEAEKAEMEGTSRVLREAVLPEMAGM